MKTKNGALLISLMSLWILTAAGVRADGNFLQIDRSAKKADLVAAATRGNLSFGANYTSYDGGWSLGASLTRDFALEDIGTLKIGPSLGTTNKHDDIAVGVKLALERYTPTPFGFVFLLGQYNTIDDDAFVLAQVGNAKGISFEISSGRSDAYTERTIAMNYRVGDGPLNLRSGYRFEAEEIFVGFALNTY